MAAMSSSLIEHKRITTTLPKAKALRSFIEPIINRAKEDTTHNRRQAFRRLRSKEAVKVLFSEVAEVLGDRPGGYTRVVKLGQRGGDSAEMAVIELVDFNDVKPEGSGSGKKRTRRSRSKKSTSASTAAAAAPVIEGVVAEENVSEESVEADSSVDTTAAEEEVEAAAQEEVELELDSDTASDTEEEDGEVEAVEVEEPVEETKSDADSTTEEAEKPESEDDEKTE